MQTAEPAAKKPMIDALFKVGAHFGYAKARRHPTAKPFIFGAKNHVELFDLEETEKALEAAKAFVSAVAAQGKQILFVGGKNEAKDVVKSAAEASGLPYAAGRFVGGTLTNFAEIRRRVDKMERLLGERETGELNRYTKKERLLIDREIDKLKSNFAGIVSMKSLPAAVFVVDPRREHIAVLEAKKLRIPVVALANSDCDLSEVDYAIPANDSSRASIAHFVEELAAAYRAGRAPAREAAPAPEASPAASVTA
ncbi:MAG TPA: 30S ribosomal protein S2 [Candidatus Paceibacterota bacterium]|nr:30S ribosomal protein S2 [Candidatus Paceibacterota bacterium]